MIGGLGVPELAIITVIIVILFGAKKLPRLGGAIGESIKNFKKGINEGDKQLSDAEKKETSDNKEAN